MAGIPGSGWGGARVGAGRPRKGEAARWLSGVPSRHKTAPQTSQAAPESFEAPADLTAGEACVWGRLAPHAFRERTLTRGTAAAFRDLCGAVALRDQMGAQLERDGLTYQKVHVDGAGQEHLELKAHPLLAQYRGMCARVEAGMLKFRLAPMGKPMESAPAKPADPFAEFDGLISTGSGAI